MGLERSDRREATVDIVICTFKRTVLLTRLLERLAAQKADGLLTHIIVVDNDPDFSSQTVIQRARQRHPAQAITLVHEPRKNIALARNAGLDACQGEFLAFVDDDELPVLDWVSRLHAAAERFGADLVFGPVLPEYEPGTPEWIIRGGFFDRPTHATGDDLPLLEARTGNVLIRAQLLERAGVRFEVELGLSGGEDYHFFKTLFPLARRAVWCDEAAVSEAVPLERATVRWLLRRSFRIGSVEASLGKRKGSLATRVRIVAKAALSCGGILLLVPLLPFLDRAWRLRALRKGAIGAGLVYGFCCGPYQEYK